MGGLNESVPVVRTPSVSLFSSTIANNRGKRGEFVFLLASEGQPSVTCSVFWADNDMIHHGGIHSRELGCLRGPYS